MSSNQYRVIIDHAIGSLGDASSQLGLMRRELHRIKEKGDWTPETLESLYNALRKLAHTCNSTLEEWEKETGVYIPRPQGRRE